MSFEKFYYCLMGFACCLLIMTTASAHASKVDMIQVEEHVMNELLSEGLISSQQFNLKKQLNEITQSNIKPLKSVKTINAGMGSISGQITDENNLPVNLHNIRLVNSSYTVNYTIQTDSFGNYTFPNLAADDYILTTSGFDSNGYGYLRYVWKPQSAGGPQLDTPTLKTPDTYISVGVDENVTGIDVSTRVGGVVRGFVREVVTKNPVSTFGVILYNVAGSEYRTSANSDSATGEYIIDAVPNGVYKLFLFPNENNLHIPQVFGGSECNNCSALAMQGQGDDFIIDNYNIISTVNFDVNLGASISGKIVDANTGNALPGISAFLIFDELNNFLFYQLIGGTDIDPTLTGDYTIGGLLPGSYYVQGGDVGLDFYQREVYNNTPCYWSGCVRSVGTPIVVQAGQDTPNIDFLLEKGGKISGTITSAATGLPITDANVQVQFLDANEVVVGGGYTQADGTYISARALPAGDYAVRTGNLFVGVLTNPYVNKKYNDIICSGLACDLTTADVHVTVGNVTPNIDFVLDTGLSFSGTITEVGTGNPIPDVHVLVYKDMGDGTVKFANWATTSDGSNTPIGSFTVDGLPSGTYYAVTNNGHRLPFLGYPPSAGNGWLDILYDGMICPANGCDIISGTPIVLTTNKATSAPLNIQLAKGASISGQVTDDVLGAPIAEIQINVYNQSGVYYGSYTTDELGYYKTAGLPADTYYLTTSSFDVLIDTVYGNKPCYFSACNPSDALPIVLSTQQDAINKNFVLIPKSDFFFINGFE